MTDPYETLRQLDFDGFNSMWQALIAAGDGADQLAVRLHEYVDKAVGTLLPEQRAEYDRRLKAGEAPLDILASFAPAEDGKD